MNTALTRTLAVSAAVLATSMQADAASTAPVAYTPPTAAAAGAAPIRIARVELPHFTASEFNQMPRYLTISFTNEQTQPAIDVVIGMLDSKGRVVDRYDDAGTFSPGVMIAAQVPFDQILDKVASAEVEAVTFADGSTWTKTENINRRQSTF